MFSTTTATEIFSENFCLFHFSDSVTVHWHVVEHVIAKSLWFWLWSGKRSILHNLQQTVPFFKKKCVFSALDHKNVFVSLCPEMNWSKYCDVV